MNTPKKTNENKNTISVEELLQRNVEPEEIEESELQTPKKELDETAKKVEDALKDL